MGLPSRKADRQISCLKFHHGTLLRLRIVTEPL